MRQLSNALLLAAALFLPGLPALAQTGSAAASDPNLEFPTRLHTVTREGYTIATYTGALAGAFDASNLPKPWYVMRDRVNKRVQLRSENGTMLRVK